MTNYFRNIFASDYDRDPGFVRLVRVVLTISTLATMVIAVVLAIVFQRASSVVAVLLIAVLSAVSLFFAYRNILWPGKVIFPLTILAAVTFLAINANGLHDSAIVGFTIVIIFTSLFAGQKALPLATFSTLLGVWIVAYADMTGINQSTLAHRTGWDDVAVISIIQIIAAASLNGLMTRLNSALETSRANELAQIKSNQELRELQADLEQRVRERTVVAEAARAAAEAAAAEAQAARKDIEMQMWLAMGQTQLADVMRGEQTISQLAENVISQLCRYVGAQAGALYLLKEKTLTLEGRYAFSERPGFEGSFKLGEGLVGQAAADGKVMYLADIPSETLVISTGLVDLKPRQMVAAPFYMNGKVMGVLELATLSEFTQTHLELWKRISETLGVAFYTVQTRQRLAEALMESQQQSEELQAQEEELRAANEELLAQAENLKVARIPRTRQEEAA